MPPENEEAATETPSSPQTTLGTEQTSGTTPGETTGENSLLNEATPAGAPERYEAFKVPDGFTLDEKVSGEVSELFKKQNLTQEQGQSLVDFYVKQTQDAANAPYQKYDEMRKGWREEIRRDPDIGSRLDQVKVTVSRALDSLGDANLSRQFREAMDLTGAGDHPAFIRAFYRLAQRVTEASHVVGNGPAPTGQNVRTGRPSTAQAMYPTLPSSN
jgi:hypothetical protein